MVSAETFGMRRLGAVAAGAAIYMAAFGSALAAALGADDVERIAGVAPAVGIALLGFSSQADRQQYVARVLAATLFLAIGLLMWAGSHERAGWWLLGFVAIALLAFLAWLVWLAQFTTRIEPVSGAQRVDAGTLVRRLESLSLSGWRITATADSVAGARRVEVVGDGDRRTHRIVLLVPAAGREVVVREFVGATAASPRDASERSMRAIGDPAIDPTRPEAQRIWSRVWQTTMIVPQALAAVALSFDGARVRWNPPAAPPTAEAALALLAAVVTRSGYVWQPRLVGKSA